MPFGSSWEAVGCSRDIRSRRIYLELSGHCTEVTPEAAFGPTD